MPAPLVRTHNLTKRYLEPEGREVSVLAGLSLEIQAGDFVAIVGASGSGKSTLLHVLGALDADFTGEVEVAGLALRGLPESARARFRGKQVGMVFQSFHLLPHLSALENVLLPAHFSAEGKEDRAWALALLERVGLAAKAQRPPSRLSGGERQRVAIARALYARPRVLLCDEPTGNLDATTGSGIISLFSELNREGLTLLAVTHEERLSAAAQRVLRLSEGQLVQVARPESGS